MGVAYILPFNHKVYHSRGVGHMVGDPLDTFGDVVDLDGAGDIWGPS
jgi:hypothetical protein